MDDLVAFLSARLAEDETTAPDIHDRRDCDIDAAGSPGNCTCGWPARAPREVAAKRAILRTYEGLAHPPTQEGAEMRRLLSTDVLPALTAIYSSHPDYRDEWKPRDGETPRQP